MYLDLTFARQIGSAKVTSKSEVTQYVCIPSCHELDVISCWIVHTANDDDDDDDEVTHLTVRRDRLSDCAASVLFNL